MGVELDPKTRAELKGKRFSEFWAARQKVVEGPVEVRDLPPWAAPSDDDELEGVAGGIMTRPLVEQLPHQPALGPLWRGDIAYLCCAAVTSRSVPSSSVRREREISGPFEHADSRSGRSHPDQLESRPRRAAW